MNITPINPNVIGSAGTDNGIAVPQVMVLGRTGPVINFSCQNGVLPSALELSRTSQATYFDASGVMQLAEDGTARFDYDPVTLALRGLLLEQQNSNYMVPSEVTTTDWGESTGVTLSDTGNTGFFGNSAMRVTQTDNSGPRVATPSLTFGVETTGVIKFYILPGTAQFVQMGAASAISDYYVNFDLASLTYAIITGTVGPITSAGIQKNASGMIEVYILMDVNSTPATGNFYLSFANDLTTARIGEFTGTTGTYFVLCAGDLKMGTVIDSHIVTSTAVATRAADALSATLPSSGSIYREYQNLDATAITKEVVSVADGLMPDSFNGWVRVLQVWGRTLTDNEKAALLG